MLPYFPALASHKTTSDTFTEYYNCFTVDTKQIKLQIYLELFSKQYL